MPEDTCLQWISKCVLKKRELSICLLIKDWQKYLDLTCVCDIEFVGTRSFSVPKRDAHYLVPWGYSDNVVSDWLCCSAGSQTPGYIYKYDTWDACLTGRGLFTALWIVLRGQNTYLTTCPSPKRSTAKVIQCLNSLNVHFCTLFFIKHVWKLFGWWMKWDIIWGLV